jgi:hypothetical protein
VGRLTSRGRPGPAPRAPGRAGPRPRKRDDIGDETDPRRRSGAVRAATRSVRGRPLRPSVPRKRSDAARAAGPTRG